MDQVSAVAELVNRRRRYPETISNLAHGQEMVHAALDCAQPGSCRKVAGYRSRNWPVRAGCSRIKRCGYPKGNEPLRPGHNGTRISTDLAKVDVGGSIPPTRSKLFRCGPGGYRWRSRAAGSRAACEAQKTNSRLQPTSTGSGTPAPLWVQEKAAGRRRRKASPRRPSPSSGAGRSWVAIGSAPRHTRHHK
jgi:hypothetical protein